MIQIRFSHAESERKALGFLAGNFSFKTSADGRTLVPAAALAPLAIAGIVFTVEGKAAYEHFGPTTRSAASDTND